MSTGPLLRLLRRHAIWCVLLLMIVIGALISDAFTRPVYLINILRQAAPVGIAAVGVTLVMIMGGVDLSIGAIVSVAAVTCAALMDGDPGRIVIAVVGSCVLATAIGAANGVLIGYSRVSPFILTLGTAIVIYGMTQIVTGGTARGAVSPGFREFFNQRLGSLVPVLAITFIGIALVGVALQRWTRFGRSLYLLGANPQSARLCGLPVRRVTILAYAASGFFGGLAGLALLARSGVSGSLAASGYEFDVLAAVVLGGTSFQGGRGGIGGTIAGVLILMIAFNLVNVVGLDYHAQLIVKGLIIVAASAIYHHVDSTPGEES
jgi:ribose/xylose/arabinose/galactoside ABC-type transport system permease subunit